MKKPFLLCSGRGFRRYFRQEAKVFFSVSMLMGLAMWAFMPVSGASYTSRTKALAVMAMVGMVMASVSIKNLKKVPTKRCDFRSVQRIITFW